MTLIPAFAGEEKFKLFMGRISFDYRRKGMADGLRFWEAAFPSEPGIGFIE
jgi:hypothetical protein